MSKNYLCIFFLIFLLIKNTSLGKHFLLLTLITYFFDNYAHFLTAHLKVSESLTGLILEQQSTPKPLRSGLPKPLLKIGSVNKAGCFDIEAISFLA